VESLVSAIEDVEDILKGLFRRIARRHR
jgi:hypothetical protein